MVYGTFSGATLSFSDPAFIYSADTTYFSMAKDATLTPFNAGGSLEASWLTAPTTSAGRFIGVAKDGISDAAEGSVQLAGSVVNDLTGLEAGSVYYLGDLGELVTEDTGFLAGRALSTTDLLISGGDR